MAANPQQHVLQATAGDPLDLPLTALREQLASGALSAVSLTQTCLRRIQQRDAEVQAWACMDESLALNQAEMLDRFRQSGHPVGPLHGIPVGIKDIIDTDNLLTENGSAVDHGRQPADNAWVVSRLRAAGAVILGKTVTTECAFLAPAKTRNPHNPEHTPGGSSAGSAAAVAAGMVPIALGTQTGGSIIRPASYCGVVGFKPSFGLVPRSGILRNARSLDTVGGFGHSIEAVALLTDVLAGFDKADPATRLTAAPRLLEIASSEPPVTPQLAFIKTSAWQDISPDCAEGFSELQAALGDHCDEVELPSIFAEAGVAQRRIMLAEMAYNLRHYYDRGRDRLAEETRRGIEEGRNISAIEYQTALAWRDTLYAGLEEIFERYDAIITPATAGEAPPGLHSTGSAAFNVLWTLTGVPAISLPLLSGANGLPIGVQLVGRRHNDGRLLRTARWLVNTLVAAD